MTFSNLTSAAGQAAPAHPFEVHAVTPDFKTAFFNLIQEQAAQHGSVVAHTQQDIDDLHAALGHENGTNAFLVIDAVTRKALSAVTYFPALSTNGMGMYLDDIITTRSERGRGVGAFALATLAHIAKANGASHIALECAAHNKPAQNFYDDLGGSSYHDRQTWRTLGAWQAASQETGLRVRPVEQSDAAALAVLLSGHNAHSLVQSVRSGDAMKQNGYVLALAEDTNGLARGVGLAYRSFSSFRRVSGLHVSNLVARNEDKAAAIGLLDYFGQVQKQRGWLGHLDFTVPDANADFLTPLLSARSFTPLAYDNDPMVVRCFSGAPFAALAQRNLAPASSPALSSVPNPLRTLIGLAPRLATLEG